MASFHHGDSSGRRWSHTWAVLQEMCQRQQQHDVLISALVLGDAWGTQAVAWHKSRANHASLAIGDGEKTRRPQES
jgi:hypothetical protein